MAKEWQINHQESWENLDSSPFTLLNTRSIPSTVHLVTNTHTPLTTLSLNAHLDPDSSPHPHTHSLHCTLPTSLPNLTLLTRFKPSQAKFQLQTAHQLRQYGTYKLFGSVQIPAKWEGFRWKLGVGVFNQGRKAQMRVIYQDGKPNTMLQMKSQQYTGNNYSGMLLGYDLTQLECKQIDLLYTWNNQLQNTWLAYRAHFKAQPHQRFNSLALIDSSVLSLVHRLNQHHSFAVEARIQPSKRRVPGGKMAWHYRAHDQMESELKVHADSERNLAVGISSKIIGYGRHSFNVDINDFGGLNRCRFGVRVELEI